MLNIFQFTRVLVVFYGISRTLGQTLPDETLYKDNACYGSASYSYFSANCFTNHAIAVSKVLGGAKPNTTDCPPEIDWTQSINFSLCCASSPGDCIEDFSGALKTYHDGCSGEQACKFGTGAIRYRFVNCQEPLVNNSFNSYMELDYYCIDKSTIGSTCTSVSMTRSGKTLYLWNNGYPSTATADCNCSIEVNSSTAQIDVMAMRIELAGNSSSCIRFLDGVCDAKEITLCSNVFTITNTFTSTSNYLLMKYIRGRISDPGRYWIRFKATNSSANLIVRCQPESKPVCTTTTSITTTSSTTTSTTTPSTTTSTTSTPSTTTSTTNTPSTTTSTTSTPSTTTSTTSTPSTTTSTTNTPSTMTSTTSTPSTTTPTTSTPSTTTSTTNTPSTTTSTTNTPSTTTIINTTTIGTTTTKTSTVTTTSGTTPNTTGSVTPSTTIHMSNSTTKPTLNEEKAFESVLLGVLIGVICLLLLIVGIVIIYVKVIKPARNRKAAEQENKRVEQATELSDSKKESMIEQVSFSGGRNSSPPAAYYY